MAADLLMDKVMKKKPTTIKKKPKFDAMAFSVKAQIDAMRNPKLIEKLKRSGKNNE